MVAALPQLPRPGRHGHRRLHGAVEATGYDGWLSHEIFNDRFRMASPRRIAEDGERSLIWLGDRLKPGAIPPRVKPEAVEWIEFAVSEDDAGPLAAIFAGLGFRETGRHRSKAVTRWTQGGVNLVINTDPEGLAHSHQIVHGPSVVAIGLRVGDAAAALQRAEALRIPAFRQPVGPGELDIPAIRGLGGSLIYFTDPRLRPRAGLGDRVRARRRAAARRRSPASTTSPSR